MPGVSIARRKEVYVVTAERSGAGFPMVAFEGDFDLAEISRRIRVPASCGLIRPGAEGEGLSFVETLRAQENSFPL